MSYMDKALELKEMSKSRLAKVGAVLVKDDKVTGIAYNADYDNALDELEYQEAFSGNLVTKPEVIHAEERVIADAARFGESTQDAQLYVTLAPCFKCVRLIIASGIKKVYYKDVWWDKNALEYLKKYVKVERVK